MLPARNNSIRHVGAFAGVADRAPINMTTCTSSQLPINAEDYIVRLPRQKTRAPELAKWRALLSSL